MATVVVGGNMVRVSATFTRPADTAPYVAKDVVADATSAAVVRTFTDAARTNGWAGYIVGARGISDQKTMTARLRLHLFHTAPTAIQDNAPFTLLFSNAANRIGVVDLPAMATEDPTNSTAAMAVNFTDRIPFVCAAGDRSIYAMVETLDAFTPASGQQFFFELVIDQS